MLQLLTPQERQHLSAYIRQLIIAKREEMKRDFQKAVFTPPTLFQPKVSKSEQLRSLKKQRFLLEQRVELLKRALENSGAMQGEKAWKHLKKTYKSLEQIEKQIRALQSTHARTR